MPDLRTLHAALAEALKVAPRDDKWGRRASTGLVAFRAGAVHATDLERYLVVPVDIDLPDLVLERSCAEQLRDVLRAYEERWCPATTDKRGRFVAARWRADRTGRYATLLLLPENPGRVTLVVTGGGIEDRTIGAITRAHLNRAYSWPTEPAEEFPSAPPNLSAADHGAVVCRRVPGPFEVERGLWGLWRPWPEPPPVKERKGRTRVRWADWPRERTERMLYHGETDPPDEVLAEYELQRPEDIPAADWSASGGSPAKHYRRAVSALAGMTQWRPYGHTGAYIWEPPAAILSYPSLAARWKEHIVNEKAAYHLRRFLEIAGRANSDRAHLFDIAAELARTADKCRADLADGHGGIRNLDADTVEGTHE